METWVRAFAILILLAGAAHAQTIVLDPPGPTSRTPIEARLYVACDPLSHTLDRLGNVIKIHVTPGPGEGRCDPPIPAPYAVNLGTLPVGEYRIEVMVGARDQIIARTFVVRNAAHGVFEVHPFAVPVHPSGLVLRLDAPELTGEIATISVDGVAIAPQRITRTDDGAYLFPAPMHARGLADVTIQTAGGATHTRAGALYYYEHTAPPDLSVFERILFPVLVSTSGAFGSQWVSETAIANPDPWTVETFNDVVPYQCIDYPCGERLPPQSFETFSGDGYPHGIALLAPRPEGDRLAFSLRVRDTSRVAEGYGTQVPVVRERNMVRGAELTLLDIPVDARYRTKVRIYAFDTGAHDAEVTLVEGEETLGTYSIPIGRQCSGIECHFTPWYGELDLATTGQNRRVNLYVRVGGNETPAWAFASITNNETQQVTIVTSDGAGGRP